MNIAIMRAFVEVRRVLLKQNDLREQMKEIKERLGGRQVYNVPIAIGRKFVR